jgi:diguanylate cyclase (GGDEF)-like protein
MDKGSVKGRDMNTWMVVTVISIVSFMILLIGVYLFFKKNLAKVTEDLDLFKKEKEYYSEAILTFSSDYQITFANQPAKDLFSLNANNEVDKKSKAIALQMEKESPEDFFSKIKNLHVDTRKNVKFYNATLIHYGKRKKINLYLGRSDHNNKQMISCIIEMDTEKHTVSDQKNQKEQSGSINVLTGLPNQFTAISEINSLIIQSKKNSGSFSILLLGIDHFNDIQTTLGLSYSNQVLKTLAQFFLTKQDEHLSIYHLEADNFLLLLRSKHEDIQVNDLSREMIIAVGNVFRDNNDIRLTSSIGISQFPKDGTNATKLIDNAYITLKKAQNESESNIKRFRADHSIGLDEAKMNKEIRAGLEKNEFLLHFQPIFDLAGERIIGAEALVRWKHPEHGLITADKFLDTAEKTGLIVDLGEYVFNEAIQERQRCNSVYTNDFQITINLSLKEMQVDQLIPKLELLFKKYDVQRNAINLDISESAVMEHIDKTVHDFKLLNEFGLSLSIDNIGSSFSSFKYLSMFPLNMIKIDRSLIFDLTLNLEHQNTVRAIINFAHTLGYKVVAEGVETTQEATILKTLNCDYAQGYLYSRPLPAQEFEALLS